MYTTAFGTPTWLCGVGVVAAGRDDATREARRPAPRRNRARRRTARTSGRRPAHAVGPSMPPTHTSVGSAREPLGCAVDHIAAHVDGVAASPAELRAGGARAAAGVTEVDVAARVTAAGQAASATPARSSAGGACVSGVASRDDGRVSGVTGTGRNQDQHRRADQKVSGSHLFSISCCTLNGDRRRSQEGQSCRSRHDSCLYASPRRRPDGVSARISSALEPLDSGMSRPSASHGSLWPLVASRPPIDFPAP